MSPRLPVGWATKVLTPRREYESGWVTGVEQKRWLWLDAANWPLIPGSNTQRAFSRDTGRLMGTNVLHLWQLIVIYCQT